MTSSWEMSCMLTSKLLCSCSSFSDVDGSGQFSTSWKWSLQRFISSSCVLANLPLASFMCVLWILYPVSSFTLPKRCFESSVFAAFSASFALSLNHCCLSALHLFLTSLSFALYLTYCSTSLPVDSACNFNFFSAFLSSVAFHVLSVIHLSFFIPLQCPRIVCAVPVMASWKKVEVRQKWFFFRKLRWCSYKLC